MENIAERIQMMSVQFLPFMVAVIFHEFAHGWVAHKWGDNTARDAGRLTLNPVPHIDPIGTLLLPIMGMLGGFNVLFGWAKPVPINPNHFRKYRPGLIWVSAAGSAMNFILAVFSAFVLVALIRWMPSDSFIYEPVRRMTGFSIQLNFMLGLFNLLPVPPLDGSKIIQAFLPFDKAMKFEQFGSYVSWIFLFLAMTGALSVVFYPIIAATQFFTEISLTLAAFVLHLNVGTL